MRRKNRPGAYFSDSVELSRSCEDTSRRQRASRTNNGDLCLTEFIRVYLQNLTRASGLRQSCGENSDEGYPDAAKEMTAGRSEDRGPAVFPSAAVSGLSGFSHRVGCLCPACSATGTAVCLKGSPVKQRAPPTARRSAK